MSKPITVPTLGESITEATVARWFKAVGDQVVQDEPLVELETDKVTVEVPSPASGVLTEIVAASGAEVLVGGVLGSIGDSGAAVKPAAAKATAAAKPAAAQPGTAKPAPAPAAAAAPAPARDGALSPAVRALVDEHGLDAAAIPATGPKGQLTKGDVLAFVEARAAKAAAAPAARPAVAKAAPAAPAAPVFVPAGELAERPEDPRGEERVRMSRLRQRIAQRLKEAQNTAAMLTTFNEVDMTALMELRNQYREPFEKKFGARLGFMSFFVKAAVTALRELPAVNAEIHGDEIIYKNFYDIGVAVGTPHGLVVPVLRDADRMNFADIESAIADFGRRARDGKLTLQEMSGGTFTISNGGVYGSLLSTPILNPPQSGILGLHKVQKRPVAVGDKVEIRNMMYLALSYDHRIVDGREAVTFLVRLKDMIEDPQRLLIDV